MAPMTLPWYPAGSLRFKKSESDSENSTSVGGRSVPALTLESYPPEAIKVQNTFISIVSPRSETQPSLSCPASRIGCLKALFCEDADAHDTLDVSKDVPEKELGNVGNVEVEALLSFKSASLGPALLAPAPTAPPMVPAPTELIELPVLVPPPGPALGSPELPSVGSKTHLSDGCKPCAFHHAKGCRNGVMCPFCHLCDRGEKKRRQKVKNARKAALSRGDARHG